MRGTIQGIDHTRGSGIATLILLDESGDISLVHADAGPLFREIAASGVRPGTYIEYEVTSYGTLACFQMED